MLAHFRVSLRASSRALAGPAPVIFVQPASNLKDFTPFKSEHAELAAEELHHWEALMAEGQKKLASGQHADAIAAFQEAVRIDSQHALGLWNLGDALWAAGRDDEAMEYFTRAKDEDVCPLRALSEERTILTEVAKENGVAVVDYPRLLAEKHRPLPAVGLDCFLDHVHPTVEAHGELGAALADKFRELGIIRTFARSTALDERVRRQVLSQLGPYDHAMALHTLAMTLSWGGKTREALRLAEGAAKLLPEHPEVISQYGRLLEKSGRPDEALQVYQRAVQADPNDSMALARLGNFYGQHHNFQQARECLEKAVANTPERAPVAFRVQIRLQLGDCLQALGDRVAAQVQYREGARLDPQLSVVHQRRRLDR